MFIERHLRKEIERSLKACPVVGIVGCRKSFIVYPGSEAYPLDKDVFVLPLKNIMDIVK